MKIVLSAELEVEFRTIPQNCNLNSKSKTNNKEYNHFSLFFNHSCIDLFSAECPQIAL